MDTQSIVSKVSYIYFLEISSKNSNHSMRTTIKIYDQFPLEIISIQFKSLRLSKSINFTKGKVTSIENHKMAQQSSSNNFFKFSIKLIEKLSQ